LRFSIRNDILRISSKRGHSLNAVFCPQEIEPKKGDPQFRADNSEPPAQIDLFITNVENRQEINEKDSLKGHFKDPQIPLSIYLFQPQMANPVL